MSNTSNKTLTQILNENDFSIDNQVELFYALNEIFIRCAASGLEFARALAALQVLHQLPCLVHIESEPLEEEEE